MTHRISREIVEGPGTASDGTVVLSGQVYLRAERQYAEKLERGEIKPHNAESECQTCKGDPEVCAFVPGLRHCEKANQEDANG